MNSSLNMLKDLVKHLEKLEYSDDDYNIVVTMISVICNLNANMCYKSRRGDYFIVNLRTRKEEINFTVNSNYYDLFEIPQLGESLKK